MRTKRKMRTVKVGMIKAASAWGEVRANVRLLERLALALTKEKLDVLVTPECFLDGYMTHDRKKCNAAKLRSCSVTGPRDPIIKRVGRLAATLKSYIVLGASERSRDGTVRNAAYLLGRDGNNVGTYYKLQTNEFYAPGENLPVFQTDFGTIGILICADRRWPEHARCLRLLGAEIIFNPTWGTCDDRNIAIMRTRAYENGLPICFTHPQQSLVSLPDGSIGAVLESNQPSVLVHDLDLSKNDKAKNTRDRANSAPVQNRRPELYRIIAETGRT